MIRSKSINLLKSGSSYINLMLILIYKSPVSPFCCTSSRLPFLFRALGPARWDQRHRSQPECAIYSTCIVISQANLPLDRDRDVFRISPFQRVFQRQHLTSPHRTLFKPCLFFLLFRILLFSILIHSFYMSSITLPSSSQFLGEKTRRALTMPRTPLLRWTALGVFVFVLFFYRSSLSGTIVTSNDPAGANTAFVHGGGDDLTFVKALLQKHKIGPEMEYASRMIRYVPDAKERKSITEVDGELFPSKFDNITIDQHESLPLAKLLDLHVKQSARPDQIDASSLIFGVSTTFERFHNEKTSPVKEWTRWLTDGHGHSNGAGLVLALFNTSESEIDHASQTLADMGINATVVPSNNSLDMPGRYVDLVRMIYNHPTSSSRKYFSLIDDDTFFPCMHELLRILSSYKPDKPYYIGTFTERTDWMMSNRVPMAYGGGGIFLTAPTAQRIVALPCLERTENGKAYVLGSDQGDRLLYNCLHAHTDISLTYLPLLHQEDQFGDPSGFYESGLQFLSLHHYKSWHHFRPDVAHTVADACGEDCVLQRFQFSDNYILSNGYSVAHYPKGIDFDPLLMEGTFGHGNDKEKEFGEVVFSYAFGMLRKSLSSSGRKRTWEVLGARKEGDGRVRQVYVKRKTDKRWIGEGEEAPERDSVVVLTWIP